MTYTNLNGLKKLQLTATAALFYFINLGNATAQSVREDFLVETVSRYSDSTNYATAVFNYDSNHKLLSRNISGKMVEANQVIDVSFIDEFEYVNGKVSKIAIKDFTHFAFNQEHYFFYDAQDKLVRKEIWMHNIMVSHTNYHYQNGRVTSTYDDNSFPFDFNTIVYDSLGNISQQTQIYPDGDLIGQPIPGQFIIRDLYYEYDNNPKPNFGLDYLFGYQPFPFLGSIVDLEIILSNNNLTKAVFQKQTYNYTYNQYGLPETIHDIYDPIGPVPGQLYTITYKQIGSLGIEDKKVPAINIYPNPTTDVVNIECDMHGTLFFYDMTGRAVLTKDFDLKTAVNTAQLSSGVYSVKLISKDRSIITNSKVIKK